VVCDDESPDNTAAALGDLLGKVTLIHQEHRGISAARNNAARRARGDWIVLLDQDDEWLPERLAATAAVIGAGPPALDVVATDATVRAPGGAEYVYSDAIPFEPDDQRSMILRHNFVYASAAVRRAAWERIGGFNDETDDEYDTWVRLVFSGSVIATTGEPLAVYHTSVRQKSRDGLWLHSSKIATMQWVLSRSDLSRDERRAAAARLAQAKADLLVSRALVAVADRSPEARHRALRTSVARRVSPVSRVKLALSGLAPSLGARYLRRSAGGAWYGPGANAI
jgi:GT2 family glycosyltransferase